ncbi:hypothetical protein [Corynebacterium poyangense]|nr:hypothetical protein [Corynebacterium poyangense]
MSTANVLTFLVIFLLIYSICITLFFLRNSRQLRELQAKKTPPTQ